MQRCRVFLLSAVLCHALLLTTKQTVMARDLTPGDIGLPSQTIVRLANAPRTAEEIKRQTQQTFQNMVSGKKTTPPAESWKLSLQVVDNPQKLSHQAICQEYIASQVQYRMRPVRNDSKHLTVTITLPDGTSETCNFDIQNRVIIVPADTEPKLDTVPKFVNWNLPDYGNVPMAILGKSSRPDVSIRFIDFAVAVPFPLNDRTKLVAFLSAAAREAFRTLRQVAMTRPNKVVERFALRLLAVAQAGDKSRFRLPGIEMLAFNASQNNIFLVEKLNYKLLLAQKKGAPKTSQWREQLVVVLQSERANSCLAAKSSSPLTGAAATDCINRAVEQESEAAVQSFAAFAADQYQVGTISFSFNIVSNQPGVGLRWPVHYQRSGQGWVRVETPQKNTTAPKLR